MKSFCVVALAVTWCVLGSMAAPSYEHAAPAHHSMHTYHAKAPAVKCGANLLVGCAPHVAHVPCVPHQQHGGYHAPAPSHHGGHGGYRAAESSAGAESE
ncbi:vitelline membrane protein 15a-2-like [Topomyia yanbarensis]|uniref:vitelline membrane protein 15a-2-like n=1 Tax=Topomyia yanbarensis TaxID=2498891 RepID=UPI00273AB635|nr:vitelline membrane protein 15a-2-like [Topomyia yanbarensis]